MQAFLWNSKTELIRTGEGIIIGKTIFGSLRMLPLCSIIELGRYYFQISPAL